MNDEKRDEEQVDRLLQSMWQEFRQKLRLGFRTILFCIIPFYTLVCYGCLTLREGLGAISLLSWLFLVLAWLASGLMLEGRWQAGLLGLCSGLWVLRFCPLSRFRPGYGVALGILYGISYSIGSYRSYRLAHPRGQEPEGERGT